jgi:hypothetical protein
MQQIAYIPFGSVMHRERSQLVDREGVLRMDESSIEPTDDATTPRGVTRRRALATIGAGTAAVWAAPAILSTTRAFAQSAGPGACTQCSGDFCSGQTNCGNNNVPPFDECPCAQKTDGSGCFCYQDNLCANSTPCPNGQGDCPSGTVCVHTCCDSIGPPVCFTPCGTPGVQTATKGLRGSGK